MKVKVDMVNAERNFAAGVDQMGRLTGLDPKAIVRAEAGSILKKCFIETKPPPSQATLTTAGRLRAIKALGYTQGRTGNPITVNAGKKGPYGRVFIRKKNGDGFRRTHDDNFRPLNQHYTNEQWEALQAAVNDTKVAVAKVVPEVRGAAGLARKSWLTIAQTLGIRLEAVPGGRPVTAAMIAKVQGAKVPGDKQNLNGTSRVDETAHTYLLTLINRLPYGKRLGFPMMLRAAVAGRAAFMQTALARGFNGSLEQTAKLFPGWTVKPR